MKSGNKIISYMRKRLGDMKRTNYRINNAYWYCKYLAADEYFDVERIDGLKVEFNDSLKTTLWIKTYHKMFPWIYNSREMESAMKYDYFLPSLEYQGAIIGYLKIARERAYVEDYEGEIVLKADEVFILDTFILPEFRGRHMGSFMLGHVLYELRKKGITFVFCHIPGWNKSSLKLYQNMGFKHISNVWYFRILKLRHMSCNPDMLREKGRRLFDVSPQNI